MTQAAEGAAETVVTTAAQQAEGYDQHEHDHPLGSYLALMGVYGAYAATVATLVARKGELPERIGAADLALTSVATFQLARLSTKGLITSPLRAPFTELEGKAGAGEVQEGPRGSGMRRALGDLAVCPFCAAQWFATSCVGGLLLKPRATRAVMSTVVAVAGADALQFVYTMLENKAEG